MSKFGMQPVYDALETEYDYQERRWGPYGRNHEVAAWLTYMQSYLDVAKNLASTNFPETIALEPIRKVVAMGCVCLREHGAPHRKE